MLAGMAARTGKFTASLLVLIALPAFLLPLAAQQLALPDSRAASSEIHNDPNLPAANAIRPTIETAPHRFWDKTNIWLFSGVAVTRALDYTSTRNMLARGREEILLPDDVVNNHAGFAALEAAGTMTSVGISYIFHRTGHHTLERWMSIGSITVTGFGAARNYALESRHPARSGEAP